MDTRSQLIAEATTLLRSRGYCGFSYADLAERVGIRKASIHHHFPSKQDLGVELVDSYSRDFLGHLDLIWSGAGEAPAMLEAYADLYRDSLNQGLACLCGILASEVGIAPPTVAIGVARFMAANRHWLEKVVVLGQQQGAIAQRWEPQCAAELLLSICQGALLVARASGERESFDRAVNAMLAQMFHELVRPR